MVIDAITDTYPLALGHHSDLRQALSAEEEDTTTTAVIVVQEAVVEMAVEEEISITQHRT